VRGCRKPARGRHRGANKVLVGRARVKKTGSDNQVQQSIHSLKKGKGNKGDADKTALKRGGKKKTGRGGARGMKKNYQGH